MTTWCVTEGDKTERATPCIQKDLAGRGYGSRAERMDKDKIQGNQNTWLRVMYTAYFSMKYIHKYFLPNPATSYVSHFFCTTGSKKSTFSNCLEHAH